jgi:hypothetical protein
LDLPEGTVKARLSRGRALLKSKLGYRLMHDDFEDLLANEDEITPSSGFVASVMAAVEREVAVPRPLEFPWGRALPGLLATIAALALAVWQGIDFLRDPTALATLDEQLRRLTLLADAYGLQWITLAVALTIVSVALPSSLSRVRLGT